MASILAIFSTLVILTILRPQRTELIARVWLFPWIWDQKGMNVLPDFCLFSRIWEQKELTYLSIFDCFYESETRK